MLHGEKNLNEQSLLALSTSGMTKELKNNEQRLHERRKTVQVGLIELILRILILTGDIAGLLWGYFYRVNP